MDDESPEVRSNAAEVLGNFGPVARDAIGKLYYLRINDKSGTVSVFAHYALRKICTAAEYDGLNLKRQN